MTWFTYSSHCSACFLKSRVSRATALASKTLVAGHGLGQLDFTQADQVFQLTTATRSMEHMNGLLHETEATNALLMEQVTLLKSELRVAGAQPGEGR
ncbi:hypothetical protein CRUP_034923 [Coryphaenoides rupestris]|nr:hypothetical protein CRUP_034923 [Coryphaenoides rupestris]